MNTLDRFYNQSSHLRFKFSSVINQTNQPMKAKQSAHRAPRRPPLLGLTNTTQGHTSGARCKLNDDRIYTEIHTTLQPKRPIRSDIMAAVQSTNQRLGQGVTRRVQTGGRVYTIPETLLCPALGVYENKQRSDVEGQGDPRVQGHAAAVLYTQQRATTRTTTGEQQSRERDTAVKILHNTVYVAHLNADSIGTLNSTKMLWR